MNRALSGLQGGRVWAWVAVLAMSATACGGSGAPEAAGTTYTVGVDGSTDEFNSVFARFFPSRLTVRPGDDIVFGRPENGEPHTVTLGTAVSTSETIPGDSFFEGGFGGLPRTDSSTPCFLAEGLPPPEGCPSAQQEPVPFDGTQSWFNSGGLLGEEDFTLELADDISPGEYTFVCLVHTNTMKGTIEVAEPGQPADDPADVEIRGSEESQQQIDLIRPRLEPPPTVEEGQVLAAVVSSNGAAAAFIFIPEEIDVPVGGTVTWLITTSHTISFNAPESARPFYERAEDGSVRGTSWQRR